MNKPISMIINETKTKLATVCNESGLSPVILDLIMQGLYLEIHNLAERQTKEEEMSYMQSLKNETAEDVEAVKDVEVLE